ncbi:MAG TPA: S8 family serine peptidase [Lentimicrobium sp.]|nr:S8 family serine peptidase [Lentimicrobium sp.]
MKIFLLIIVFCSLFFQSPAQSDENKISGELLVMFKNDLNPLSNTLLKSDLEANGITVDHKLGKSLNIWLLRFSETEVDPHAVLKLLKLHPDVQLAQFNHPVTEREIIPNDPSFNMQWAFKNTGQSSGVPGADIHVTEAWELTTSGVTALGDTIVVAVIDGGVDLNHSDLNLKKNYNEIPVNGIDDDGNGYIDDFNGWNAYNGSGNMVTHDHGTHVIGIVAAKTNNALGVAGVSFNAKVLPVAGSSTTESTVVTAYDYVFTMRKLYNETNGQTGEYIVASNSSFGVDGGDPEDYPLWGAMYDSMGMVGIINVASTANRYWDVDIQGDIPTAMQNESLISVTNTTNMDMLNTQAAWGATSIDLGAPGTSIYSTRQGNTYGTKTGTSMSSPMVSGSIALMYAVTDPEKLMEYKLLPSLAVSRFKRYIISTVDTIPTLIGKTVSGGRLNTLDAVTMAANPPVLAANPGQLSITLKPNTRDTLVIQISSTTTENDPYLITIPEETPWLSTDRNNGTFLPGIQQSLQLYLNTDGLPVGEYNCNLTIDDYFLNQLVVPITLKVDTTSNARNLTSNSSVRINPNPFEDFLKININLMRGSPVNVKAYNVQGIMVASIHSGNLPAGDNVLIWSGKNSENQNVDPGVYIIAITDQFGTETMKAIKK